ncbi:MAG: phosphate butyryltransferase [Oscillospiraceae bacterium]|jgi:phosphate butyryltransferase|nr:phosphate butyryltransferase [Oscillospiraceae bacterium]
MTFRTLDDIVAAARTKKPPTLAVVAAQEENTLAAVVRARKLGFADARLYGCEGEIREILSRLGAEDFYIAGAQSGRGALAAAVADVKSGRANALMKGAIDTQSFLGAVVARENGLRGAGRLSVCAFFNPAAYHKLIAVTDFGMNESPDAAAKTEIIANAVSLLRFSGIELPKVAVLADTERVNPRVRASLDAAELKKLWENGVIRDCILEGPVSFDLATDKTAADIKGWSSPVAGDADLLVVPDIVAGNALVKALTQWGGCGTAGTVLGAKIPVVMTSRSAPADDKLYSIALAAANQA